MKMGWFFVIVECKLCSSYCDSIFVLNRRVLKNQIPEFIRSLKKLRLILSHAGLDGFVPPYIQNLSYLKVHDLTSNYGHLMIDDVAWTFRLSSLEHLGLSSVDLSGTQKQDMVFYMISSLKELSLSYCQLSNADIHHFS